MGVLDFTASKPATAPSANRRGGPRVDANGQPLPEAKLWLNVGYEVTTTNAEDEEVTRFINLPVGIALDTMEELRITGQNEEFAQLRAAQNGLLKALVEAGDAMSPGEEQEVRLVVKLRKRNEAMQINAADNPLAIDVKSLFAAK